MIFTSILWTAEPPGKCDCGRAAGAAKVSHSAAPFMAVLQLDNGPFAHAFQQILSSSNKGLLMILLPLSFISLKQTSKDFTFN